MNTGNYNSFNPQPYINRLSPFGQKVFQVMLKQWSTENSFNSKAHQQRYCEDTTQNNAIRDSHKRSVSRENNKQINYSEQKKCHLRFIGRETQVAHSPFELLILKAETGKKYTDVFRSDDLVTTAIGNDCCSKPKEPNYKDRNTDDIETTCTGSNILETSFKSLERSENVSWSNIFDTELFEDNKTSLGAITESDEIESSFPKIISSVKSKEAQDSSETFKTPFLKTVKRKSSSNEVDLQAPKVGKTESANKNMYRKEKYTKTVKNWLNDVHQNTFSDTGNSDCEYFYNHKEVNGDLHTKTSSEQILSEKKIEERNKQDDNLVTENNTNIQVTDCKKNKKNKVAQKQLKIELNPAEHVKESTIANYSPKEKSRKKNVIKQNTEKLNTKEDAKKLRAVQENFSSEERTTKKVVQAQLTNKGGKMKYEKPKNDTDDVKEGAKHLFSSIVDTAVKSSKDEKDKKNKSKFVAPIKSQIPVKEWTYNVYEFNTCTEDHLIFLKNVENSEVAVVLVFSNGFCQLNGCYTEDTCIPEGLMISVKDHINENYYYFTKIDATQRALISQLFEKNTIICYEGKNIFLYFFNLSMNLKTGSIWDAKVGVSLLDPDNPPETFSDLQKLVEYVPEYTIATDSTLQKVAWYMTLLRECFVKVKVQMVENSLWNLFEHIEMPLLPIIADMESRGVTVDLEQLRSMEHLLITKLKGVEQQCHAAAGKTFQVNSAPQVRALLFDELKLDTKCNVRIRETLVKGAKSTSEATLRSLMSIHPLPKMILEYRHLHKAHATFLTGIAQHVKDGVVKPTWVQTAAATGRIASNNPNLQAIPKSPFSLILFPESADIENPVLNFRSVYISRPGYRLLAADFKHVECRVFAHAAADSALLDALRSDDLFTVLAAKWLNKSEAEISANDRERTKRIVYASLYGAGARKLTDILDVGYDQALAIIASFNRTFPALKAFGRGVVAACARGGGRLSTLCGRARRLRDIDSTDFARRAHAERQAVNFVVQGSAADLCKLAMILCSRRLRGRSPPLRAHLLLQIHDELVWEVHEDDLDTAAGVVKEAMEGCGRACGLTLRLPVALRAGRRWGELRPLHDA